MTDRASVESNLIGALSVLADPFDVQLAAEISDMAAADVLHGLETAQRRGDVVVNGGLVRFTPGRREHAYRALGARGQAIAHARAAEVLTRVRPRDLAAIAEQWAGAVAALGPEPALRAFDAAALAAERARDWEGAARLWGRAAEVAAGADRADAATVALRRSRCLFRAGLFRDAITACSDVAAGARAAGDWRLLAEAALVVRGIGDRDTRSALLDLCRDAMRGVRDDRALESRLRSRLIMLSSDFSQGPYEMAEAEGNVNIAEASGDRRALVEALHALQMACAGPRNTARRLEIADRVERVAREADLVDDLVWPLRWRVDALFQLGQRPALDNAIARLQEYADQRHDALAAWAATTARAVLAQHEGRFEQAIRLAGDAHALAIRGDHQGGDFVYWILVSQCRLKLRGGPVEDHLLSIQPVPDSFHAFVAMQWAELGDLETAAAHFELGFRALSEAEGTELQVQTHVALASVAWKLGRTERAAEIYAALEPFAEELATPASGQAASLGSVSRYLGQMAALMNDWGRVENEFARAIRRNLETGARAEVAETRLDWATALLRRGLARDGERARSMLEQSLRAAAELGMEPLGRRAADALAELKMRGSPLTARELDVVALVADGLTNKDVAAQLHLSVRTAENHLFSVMNKLGLDNRAQVAVWFARSQSGEERRQS
jgi:DNA-binding CsgD family transcriptional regulator